MRAHEGSKNPRGVHCELTSAPTDEDSKKTRIVIVLLIFADPHGRACWSVLAMNHRLAFVCAMALIAAGSFASLARARPARSAAFGPIAFLVDGDGYALLDAFRDLVKTGPGRTDVGDLRCF